MSTKTRSRSVGAAADPPARRERKVEMADGRGVERLLRDRDEVVARDDACFREALVGTDLDFGTDPSDGPSDRRAGDGGQDLDGGVTGDDADGTTAGTYFPCMS